MAALQGSAVGWLLALNGFRLLHSVELKSEVLSGVLILLNGPVAVLLVKRSEVVVKIFIEVNIADFEAGEAASEAGHDHVAEDLVEQ